MVVSEELQQIISVVAEAGFEHLVGDILSYALGQPNSFFEGGDDSGKYLEPEGQILRAVDFLRFQTSIAEMHLNDAESFANNLLGGGNTSIAFLPSPQDGSHPEGGSKSDFSEGLREKWDQNSRLENITNLETVLKDIERSGSK